MPLVISIPQIHQEKPKYIEKAFVPNLEDAEYKQKFKEAGVYIRNKAVQAKCSLSKYTVFHIQVDMEPIGGTSKVLKRYHDFRNFDAVWRKLYPAVHDICQLPKRDLKSALLPNNEDVVTNRQKALEEYLQGLAKVNAIRSLLAQFLEVKEDDMKRALNDGRSRRATLTDHIKTKQKLQGDSKGAPSKVKIIGAEEIKSMKGNNMEANNAAMKAKQEFMDKHKGVLDALMPGRQYNLPMNSSLVPQEHKILHLGQITLNVFYMVATNTVHVEIEDVKDLPALGNLLGEPTTDSYVKIYLRPDPEKTTKRKTKVVTKSLNPSFKEAFEYKVPIAELGTKELEIGVWGKGSASVGGMGLGVSLGYVFFKGSAVQQVSGATKPTAQVYQLAPPPEQESVVVGGSIRQVKRVGSSSSPSPPSSPSPSSPSSSPVVASGSFAFPVGARPVPASPSASSLARTPSSSPSPIVPARPASPSPVAAEIAPESKESKESKEAKEAKEAKSETKGRVVESYTPSSEEAESAIGLTEGETIIVLDHNDSVWWYGRDSKGKEGYFPADCVVILDSEDPVLRG
jgi:hypothetical protein